MEAKQFFNEVPNEEARRFYEELEVASRPLGDELLHEEEWEDDEYGANKESKQEDEVNNETSEEE